MLNPETVKGRQEKFLELTKEGHTISSACRQIGLTRNAYYTWRHNSDEFRAKSDAARLSQVSVVEDALYKRALDGNVGAIVFYLCNRAPGLWQHVSTIEHRIVPDAFIRPVPELKKLSTDDLNKLREIANRAGNLELPRIVDTNATEIRPAPQRKHGDNGSNGTGDSGGPDPQP